MATLSPSLGINHIQSMVRGMYEVAKIDGVHQAEMVMLRGFYQECQRDARALTSFDDLIGVPFDVNEARLVLDSADRQTAFIQSCLLLAYADGRYSEAERAIVRDFALALGVSSELLSTLETQVADTLMQQISNIQNMDALQVVAAETREK